MPDYCLEIKQIVDYPRCRIYRDFIRSLMKDRSIRTGRNGLAGSGLFYYTVLCSFVNFRTSYLRIDGIGYTVYPGEWLCPIREVTDWLRLSGNRQAWDMLDRLQEQHLIQYQRLGRGKLVKFKICGWATFNTILEYNCPCQKDTGFFFIPTAKAAEIVSMGRCSEMDIVLDLWMNTIYNDEQVQGSDVGPVVYLRNGSGSPLLAYSELAQRWGLSKATVGRILKKLDDGGYLSLVTFPGRHGSVIYLQNYLSTMFAVSDVMIDKDEVGMRLGISITVDEQTVNTCECREIPIVSKESVCVSKRLVSVMLEKLLSVLESQGIACRECEQLSPMLYPLSAWREDMLFSVDRRSQRYLLRLRCKERDLYAFEITVSPKGEI